MEASNINNFIGITQPAQTITQEEKKLKELNIENKALEIFREFPLELHGMIFTYLNLKDRANFKVVCEDFYKIANFKMIKEICFLNTKEQIVGENLERIRQNFAILVNEVKRRDEVNVKYAHYGSIPLKVFFDSQYLVNGLSIIDKTRVKIFGGNFDIYWDQETKAFQKSLRHFEDNDFAYKIDYQFSLQDRNGTRKIEEVHPIIDEFYISMYALNVGVCECAASLKEKNKNCFRLDIPYELIETVMNNSKDYPTGKLRKKIVVIRNNPT